MTSYSVGVTIHHYIKHSGPWPSHSFDHTLKISFLAINEY